MGYQISDFERSIAFFRKIELDDRYDWEDKYLRVLGRFGYEALRSDNPQHWIDKLNEGLDPRMPWEDFSDDQPNYYTEEDLEYLGRKFERNFPHILRADAMLELNEKMRGEPPEPYGFL